MRRAPGQADANRDAIEKLTGRVDALTKSVERVAELDSKVTALQGDMKGLLSWKEQHQKSHIALTEGVHAVEGWKEQASSSLYQFVSLSRFDAFVASRFAETEVRAQQCVSQATFDAYVSKMEAAGFKPGPAGLDSDMPQTRCTGTSRLASELDAVGAVANAAKRNVAGRSASASSAHSVVNVDDPAGSVPAESSPRSPGAQAFGSLLPPAPLTWLALPPAPEDPWTDDAISVLMDVWSSHLDARLQQWMNKHGGMEFSATASQLARSPLSDDKRSGIVAIVRGAKTPPEFSPI